MRVIGAGLPRTATTTQMAALEQLGFGPCYHMRDLLIDLESGLPLWEAVVEGRPDWQRIFKGAQSTVDWPAARYYRELMDEYPEAKVLLSVRSADGWVKSMQETVWGIYFGDSVMHHVCDARAVIDPLWRRYLDLMRAMTWNEPSGALASGATLAGLAHAMERWNESVKRTVPAARLLVWDPNDGWEPLCKFLESDVPAEPLPHLNDTLGFKEGIVGGAIDAIGEWWEHRERPTEGLHGAAIA
jgi:Sulfotransferase domain